jgi:hypothetical protein
MDADLSIEHVLVGKSGKVALTVRCGGTTANVFKTDILDEAEREKAKADIEKAFPGLATPERARALSVELLRIAEETASELARKPDAFAGSEGVVTEEKSAADLLAAMPQDVRDEADAMLADHDLFKRVLDDIEALGVAGERELAGTVYSVGVSRLLDTPLSAILKGLSSSGKSYTIDKTASLFPRETVVYATQMTPQALFHMKPGSLAHRFIVAGERSHLKDDDAAEATRALREMLSAGRLSKLMPIKRNGEIITVSIEQDGPIAYVESTTMHKILDEDANRSLLLHTDEQPSQTRRVVSRLAADYGGGAELGNAERIIQRHHALQRMLQPKQVVVPFAPRLGELFPTDRVEARRAFPQVISMVKAITLLYQRQRTKDGQGRLIATAEDYQLARHLLNTPMLRLLGGSMTDAARRCGERMQKWASDIFTTTDVIRREKYSGHAVRNWLWEMHDAGVLELAEPSRGKLPAQWRWGRVSLEDIDRACAVLPTVELVFPEMSFRHSDKAQVVPAPSVMSEVTGPSG